MSRVSVRAFSVSLDGFGAGPAQDEKNPLGLRGMELHAWLFKTRMFHRMTGQEGGTTDTDNDFAENSMKGVGAWILGRNMFGPVRGAWPDESWKGWWGPNPPYHVPVFVLTHHARPTLRMEGGTVFHFVTDGIESALAQARKAAGDADVRIGGGVATIRQLLRARLIDEIHLAVAPIFLGSGENLFSGIDMTELGFSPAQHAAGADALHAVFKRRS